MVHGFWSEVDDKALGSGFMIQDSERMNYGRRCASTHLPPCGERGLGSPEGNHGGPKFVNRLCATTYHSENS